MTRSKVALSVCAVSAALCAVAILFTPPPSPARMQSLCVDRVPIARGMGIMTNCDSYEFIALARDPRKLLSPADTMRQSRPGYVAIGWAAALPFTMVSSLTKRAGDATAQNAVPRKAPYYIAFVLVNAVVMIIAGRLFLSLAAPRNDELVAVLPALVAFFLNGVTIWFFWTPHQQMFNLLIPVLAIHQAQRAGRLTGRPLFANAAAWGLLSGLGSLIYGGFLLVPATIAARIAGGWRRRGAAQSITACAMMGAIFFLPFLTWRAIVIRHTGRFYMGETQHFHQFVWIAESLRVGLSHFVERLLSNSYWFLITLKTVVVWPAIFLAVAVIMRSRLRVEARPNKELTTAIIAYYAVAIPFLWLMGFYAYRLTWILVPPLLILLACELMAIFGNRARVPRAVTMMLVAIAIPTYALIMITSDLSPYADARADPGEHEPLPSPPDGR